MDCVDAFLNLTTTTIYNITPPAETSGERVDRILGLPEVDFPTSPAPIIELGVANLSQPLTPLSTQTPLTYFNFLIASAEQGRMYIDREGVFNWEERTPNSTDASPTVVFGDDPLDASQIPFESLEVIYE